MKYSYPMPVYSYRPPIVNEPPRERACARCKESFIERTRIQKWCDTCRPIVEKEKAKKYNKQRKIRHSLGR